MGFHILKMLNDIFVMCLLKYYSRYKKFLSLKISSVIPALNFKYLHKSPWITITKQKSNPTFLAHIPTALIILIRLKLVSKILSFIKNYLKFQPYKYLSPCIFFDLKIIALYYIDYWFILNFGNNMIQIGSCTIPMTYDMVPIMKSYCTKIIMFFFYQNIITNVY